VTVTHRISQQQSPFHRDAWIEIDLNALEHNYHLIKSKLNQNTDLMAVVKSDAYGHGANVIAPVLESCGCKFFAVASVDEGIQLRECGIKGDILLLCPPPLWSLKDIVAHDIQTSIFNIKQLLELEKLYQSHPIPVQIQVNTGMNRSGCSFELVGEIIEHVLERSSIFSLRGVFTHLACAGDHPFTRFQVNNFRLSISRFPREKLGKLHVGASSSLPIADLNFDLVRIGLSLYGLGAHVPGSLAVLGVLARICLLQRLKAGDSVGYGITWTAERDSTIGLLPLGYADGIKRTLSNKIKGIYHGQAIPQIGRISMDQLSVDLTDCQNEAQIGDLVTLIGKEIYLREWAEILDTVEYEVACDLRARLPKVYVRK